MPPFPLIFGVFLSNVRPPCPHWHGVTTFAVNFAHLLVVLRDVRGYRGLGHREVEYPDAALAEALDARHHRRLDVRRDGEEQRVVDLRHEFRWVEIPVSTTKIKTEEVT